MRVATSLVSMSPRDLHSHTRLHLAYSNRIKMSAGLSPASVVYACCLCVVETLENVYYCASPSNSSFSKIMLAGSLKLAMVWVFTPQKSVNATNMGLPRTLRASC